LKVYTKNILQKTSITYELIYHKSDREFLYLNVSTLNISDCAFDCHLDNTYKIHFNETRNANVHIHDCGNTHGKFRVTYETRRKM